MLRTIARQVFAAVDSTPRSIRGSIAAMARRITLRSPLDPVALATRLKARMPATLDPGAAAGVIGRGSDRDMTLWYCRPRVANGLASRLIATIDPDPAGGSLIRGRIGVPASAGVFMGCWFGFLLLFLAAFAPMLVALHAPVGILLSFLGIPGGMIVFGAFAVRAGRRDGAADEAAMLACHAEMVDAHPI